MAGIIAVYYLIPKGDIGTEEILSRKSRSLRDTPFIEPSSSGVDCKKGLKVANYEKTKKTPNLPNPEINILIYFNGSEIIPRQKI